MAGIKYEKSIKRSQVSPRPNYTFAPEGVPAQAAPQAMSFNAPVGGNVPAFDGNRTYQMSPQAGGGITYRGAPDARGQAQGSPNPIDITQQVLDEAGQPRSSQFKKATDAGFVWNDSALADYGFSPEEIDHLKSRGLEQGSLDYMVDQGWLTPASEVVTIGGGGGGGDEAARAAEAARIAEAARLAEAENIAKANRIAAEQIGSQIGTQSGAYAQAPAQAPPAKSAQSKYYTPFFDNVPPIGATQSKYYIPFFN